MLNPSLKSRYMEEFSRVSKILASVVGYKIYPLENKNVPKIKNVKNAFFIKIINNVKNIFYIYGFIISLPHSLLFSYRITILLPHSLLFSHRIIITLPYSLLFPHLSVNIRFII